MRPKGKLSHIWLVEINQGDILSHVNWGQACLCHVLTWANSSVNGSGLAKDILMVLEVQMVVLEELTIEWWEESSKETVADFEVTYLMDSI